MIAADLLLAYITLSRLFELLWSRSNTARLLANGGEEIGAGHYPMIVALHAAWLLAMWLFGWNRLVDPGWLAVFLVLQVLRFWILFTLGRRWTTRIVVVPGEKLVRKGPYRFISHPNYVVVVGEIAVVPLTLGLGILALIFTVLNIAVLAVRIHCEIGALSRASDEPG